MREVTIACVQMQVELNRMEDNLVKMSEWIEKIAVAQKVDLIVFPELATTGYECGVRFTDFAQRVPGPSANLIAQRASEFGVYIAFGLPTKEKVESILFNSLVLVGPDGEILAEYRKVHLKGEERMAFRSGFKYVTVETDFGVLGLLHGYDLAFPEAARSLALEGAELLIVGANWEKPGAEEWRTVIRDIGAPVGTPFVERVPEPKHTPYAHQAESLRVYLVGEWQLATKLITLPEEAV